MKKGKAPALIEEAHHAILLPKRPEWTSVSGKLASGFTELGRVAEHDQAPVLHEQFVPPQVQPGRPGPPSVDVEQMLAELRAESAHLNAAILRLQRASSPAPKERWAVFNGQKAKAGPRRRTGSRHSEG
jgi:hypothetical protein